VLQKAVLAIRLVIAHWSLTIAVLALLFAAMPRSEAQENPRSILGSAPLLHAHNAYPEEGQWGNRIDRALAIPRRPIVIEQDIALGAQGRSVVSHDTELNGNEPTLQDHFFARVRPLMERALVEGRKRSWPLVVLHLDFKSNEAAHHAAVLELLQRHRTWLTTAPSTPGTATPSAFVPGPLLVLTENGAGQEAAFAAAVPAGEPLLLFGTVPPPKIRRTDDPEERFRLLRSAWPVDLVPARATSYQRWVNLPWSVVEEGGPQKAGDWSAADHARLDAIVLQAHQRGLWIRFYTLNGHAPAAGRGWSAGYNFGSLGAVRLRWQAAIRAGVDLIATDQYEDFAAILRAPK
jgi:glycerophosphoryl diester phosphodiesterase